MARVIKEIDWNGNHYTFTNTFKNTGTKSHDILTMEDQNGDSWTGETTWINRPWHRFDLEEAFTEIVAKAFGPKAVELLMNINAKAFSVEQAIEQFFSQFKPEDIEHVAPESYDESEEARKQALANYLEVNVEQVEEVGTHEFEVDGEEYRVLTDKEADEEYDEYVRNLWYDIGLDGIGGYLHDWILENAIDESELENIVREDISNYVYDMSDEEVADECVNEGIAEAEEVYDENSDSAYTPELRGDVDFDELREKLIESKFDEVDSYAEYLRDMGYDDKFFSNYIDDELVIDALKDDSDVNGYGRGDMSGYDGREHELEDGFYAYRID